MKQQPLLGFLFALITAMAWGSLPNCVKTGFIRDDATTIVWYRFNCGISSTLYFACL